MQSGTANDEHYGLAEGIDAAASSPRPHSEAFPKRHLTPLIGFRERHTTATHGEDAMLTVFDNAPPERIVGATVNQTIAAVLPPTQTTTEPKPPANEDDEDDDEPEDLSKEVVKLRDHVERLGEALDEIPTRGERGPDHDSTAVQTLPRGRKEPRARSASRSNIGSSGHEHKSPLQKIPHSPEKSLRPRSAR